MNSISPSSEFRVVGGRKVMWHRWHPEGMPIKGSFFLLHGQGDYGQRYAEVAEVFLQEGIAFATCDLPGHGLSPGKRGHIPSWELVKDCAELGMTDGSSLAPGKPVGFGGHSMGGLLALFLLGELERKPDFSWISSPLLKPDAGLPRWRPLLLRPLSYLLPKVTLATGVTADLCRESAEGEQAEHSSQFHSRVSLHWGRILLEISEVVRTQPERLPDALPLLLTQGLSDRICPPQFCEEFATRLQKEDLRLTLYPDARHEPFSDDCKPQMFADLGAWLRETL